MGYHSKPFKRVTFLRVCDMPERVASVQPSVSVDWGSLFSLICSKCFAGLSHVMFLKLIFMYVRERKLDVLLCIWPVPQCHVVGGVWCLSCPKQSSLMTPHWPLWNFSRSPFPQTRSWCCFQSSLPYIQHHLVNFSLIHSLSVTYMFLLYGHFHTLND